MFFELVAQPPEWEIRQQDSVECRVASPEQIARLEAARADPATADHRQRMATYEDRLFAEFVVAEGPWRTPPPDARVLFRTIAPPGGLYGNTVWTAVWQESDGSWWFWKQDRDPRMVQQRQPGGAPPETPDTERWRPVGGPLRAQDAHAIESSLSDRCRAAAGPFWPGEVPYVPPPPPPGAPMLPPPPPTPPASDSTVVYVEMTEQGQPVRRLGAWRTGHGNRLISAVAWPQLDPE